MSIKSQNSDDADIHQREDSREDQPKLLLRAGRDSRGASGDSHLCRHTEPAASTESKFISVCFTFPAQRTEWH